MVNKNKQLILEQIKADIISQNICPDLAQEAKNLVIGNGNLNSNVVFIGEAPGKKEDETGIPFMGAAGKFLNELLSSINLERSEIFITNIVKYRPPKNRDPKPEEKRAFASFLEREVDLVEPKVVVTLGRHSMNYFLPDAFIGEVHGKVLNIVFAGRNIKLMPLYHPAAALYNGSLRKVLQEDILKLKSHLN
jgi:DNA polymerase